MLKNRSAALDQKSDGGTNPPLLQVERPPETPTQAPEVAARAAGFRRIAGVDEAGRGPWAGPVVAAAVVLRRTRPLPIRIDDSKRLTPLARARAFDVIFEHADVGFGIASTADIDQHNILHATLLAMRRALDDLAVRPDVALIDGPFVPPTAIRCKSVIHGDQCSYVIGCASIMAKVLRDQMMAFYHELDPRYAFHRHKGYGTPLHAQRLKRWGPSLLHRHSFRPVRAALDAVALGMAESSPARSASDAPATSVHIEAAAPA